MIMNGLYASGKFDPGMLSDVYSVRRLDADDIEIVFELCSCNTQYYAYCGKDLTRGLIKKDLNALPPGTSMEQKYYLGFFDGRELVAVMDLIDGYPDSECVYIGFFMINRRLQGKGVGCRIISDALHVLRQHGIRRCRLGIDRDNPQSRAFWRKNGFEVIRTVEREDGAILVAEKQLQ